jgi:hypothetical protein
MPIRTRAITPPAKAHTGGSHPCSAQQRVAHNTPIPNQTPTHGTPESFWPSAIMSPENGGYFDAYVG